MDCLTGIAGADAASDDGDNGQTHGGAGYIDNAADAVGNGVGSHSGGAEGGDEVEHHELTGLEHTIFHTGGDTDEQNPADHAAIEFEVEDVVHLNDEAGVPEHHHDDDSGGNTGNQGTDTRTGSAHAESEDKDGIDEDIDDVDDKGVDHRNLAVAHGAEQSSAGIIDAHEGVGRSGEQEVDEGAVHDSGLYLTEDKGENMLTEDQSQDHQHHRNAGHGIEELFGSGLGAVGFLAAQILCYYNGAAGGESREDLDNQGIDVVHQGNAGNSSFAGGGNHDGISHTNGHQQELFDDQRYNQADQGITAEQEIGTIQSLGLFGHIVPSSKNVESVTIFITNYIILLKKKNASAILPLSSTCVCILCIIYVKFPANSIGKIRGRSPRRGVPAERTLL